MGKAYKPNKEERNYLIKNDWSSDSDGYWFKRGRLGYGRTYREAVKEQKILDFKERRK